MNTASGGVIHGVVNMTANHPVDVLIHQSDGGTEANTWSTNDEGCVVRQVVREIYTITSNKQTLFTKQFSIRLIELTAWWLAFGIQEVLKTIE